MIQLEVSSVMVFNAIFRGKSNDLREEKEKQESADQDGG